MAKSKSGVGGLLGMLLVILVMAGIFVTVLVTLILMAVNQISYQPPPEPKRPFNMGTVPAPASPDLPSPRTYEGVLIHQINWTSNQSGYYSPPGHGGKLWVYLPKGDHSPKSLPCVLIAPAGATVVTGMKLFKDDMPEHIPYVKAGFAVVAFEVDGQIEKTYPTDQAYLRAMRKGMPAFQAAQAGMVNARNALKYAKEKIPAVNPEQIFVAGHSSAADVALLYAAHEPSLAGCIAYMPTYDERLFRQRFLEDLYRMRRDMKDFIARSEPRSHIQRIQCPIFLFHADDDEIVPAYISRRAAKELAEAKKQVEFKTVPSGGHYDAMINEGIPAGIQWLKQQLQGQAEPKK